MKENISTEQLLKRIFHVAQLLVHTGTSLTNIISGNPSDDRIRSSIIDSKENSGENVEKLPTEEKR